MGIEWNFLNLTKSNYLKIKNFTSWCHVRKDSRVENVSAPKGCMRK
jgi:hypothetical protein